jgi:Ala-tRNA(Pro) deacylase
MMRLNARLADLFEHRGVAWRSLPHTADVTSQATAQHTHTPGQAFAKTVIVWVDGEFAMLVLPAPRKVDLEKLRRWLNADRARLANEGEMASLFPDCEIGAEPPFGNLYELPVYVSPLLSRDRITFHGGSHEGAVQMSYKDFAELAKPTVVDFVAD